MSQSKVSEKDSFSAFYWITIVKIARIPGEAAGSICIILELLHMSMMQPRCRSREQYNWGAIDAACTLFVWGCSLHPLVL